MSHDVILVFPGKYGSLNPMIPLALPYLGGILEKRGYKPKLFDMRVEEYENLSLDEALCVGISCWTGPHIKYALEFARYVREKDPRIPIIWGGVHPSALPEQTIANEYVDIVVRGEGEQTLLELVQKIDKGLPINDVQGITYKNKNGDIKSNPDREFIDLNTIPFELPYHLLKLERYPHLKLRNMDIQTSRGCPYCCSYCYNLFFNKCRYRYKNANRVLDEIEYLVNKFSLKHISFVDDEFIFNKKRVEEICHGLIERKIGIEWNAVVRADVFLTYDKNLIKLLIDSGCREFSFGVETISPRLLKLIQKDVASNTILAAAKKIKDMKITAGYLFMCGLPTETWHDLQLNMEFVDKIREIDSTAKFLFAIYTPYPGTPLYDLIKNENFKFTSPRILEDWSSFDFLHFRAPWLDEKYLNFIQNLATLSRFAFWSFPVWLNKFPYNMVRKTFSYLEKIRWKYGFFKFPIEITAAKRWRDLQGF